MLSQSIKTMVLTLTFVFPAMTMASTILMCPNIKPGDVFDAGNQRVYEGLTWTVEPYVYRGDHANNFHYEHPRNADIGGSVTVIHTDFDGQPLKEVHSCKFWPSSFFQQHTQENGHIYSENDYVEFTIDLAKNGFSSCTVLPGSTNMMTCD